MVVNDNMLTYMAQALAEETYLVPAYLTVGTTVVTPSGTDTTLTGEIGTRIEFASPSRNNDQVTFNATRSGSEVLQSTGDTIRAVAAFTTETGGDLMTHVSVPGILQTTAFDLDIDIAYRLERK